MLFLSPEEGLIIQNYGKKVANDLFFIRIGLFLNYILIMNFDQWQIDCTAPSIYLHHKYLPNQLYYNLKVYIFILILIK